MSLSMSSLTSSLTSSTGSGTSSNATLRPANARLTVASDTPRRPAISVPVTPASAHRRALTRSAPVSFGGRPIGRTSSPDPNRRAHTRLGKSDHRQVPHPDVALIETEQHPRTPADPHHPVNPAQPGLLPLRHPLQTYVTSSRSHTPTLPQTHPYTVVLMQTLC